MPNARVREFCGLKKGMGESIFLWFGHTEGMENGKNAKRECKEESMESQPRKRWIDSLHDCLEKKN